MPQSVLPKEYFARKNPKLVVSGKISTHSCHRYVGVVWEWQTLGLLPIHTPLSKGSVTVFSAIMRS